MSTATAQHAPVEHKRPHARHWIGGAWIGSHASRDSLDPATGAVIGTYADSGEDEMSPWRGNWRLRTPALNERADCFDPTNVDTEGTTPRSKRCGSVQIRAPERTIVTYVPAFSAAAMTLLIALGSSAARAESEKAPSIDTPPAVSKAALEKVRAEGRGQYAVPDGFKSDFVETEGTRLHYVSGGSGSPIVFVHGFGSTWKMWEPALRAFAGKHRVIAVDLPGLGRSEPSRTGYSAEAASKILVGAIKALTNEPIVYVCHDLCISASYPLVARNQDIIRKVVLMDSPIPDKAMWTYPGLTPEGPGLGWHFGFFAFGDVAEKLIANDPKLFMAYFIDGYAGKKQVFTDALLDELIEPYSRIENLHAAFSGYYAAHSDSVRQNEALLAAGMQITIPSLAISGEKGVDDVLPKQMAARFVANPNAFRATILPGCGHWLLEECAPEVIDELAKFIGD